MNYVKGTFQKPSIEVILNLVSNDLIFKHLLLSNLNSKFYYLAIQELLTYSLVRKERMID